jgi:hypothetical protein
MRRNLLLIFSAIIMVVSAVPASALTNETGDTLVYKGFSPYLVDIALLQESRHEGNFKYEVPDKTKSFWNKIYQADFLVPTQPFGWYRIQP